MKRCMYCGQENDDVNETCSKCGNQLIEMPPADSGVPLEDVSDMPIGEIEPEMDVPEVEDIPLDEGIFSEGGYPPMDGADDGRSQVYPPMDGANAGQGQAYPPMDGANAGQGQAYPPMGGADAGQGQAYPPIGGADVGRGQTYAAARQYEDQENAPQYGGRDYSYTDQGEQQYGGQAYGYEDPRQYGAEPDAEGGYERMSASGSKLLMKKARKRMHNPILFLAILLYTVHFVAEVINISRGDALTNLSTVSHTITKLTGKNVAINFMNSIVDLINGINKWYLLAGGLAFCVPVLLLTIGLWIAFFSTTNRKAEISTAGLTLCRVAVIVKFISVCAALLAAIVFSVSFVVSAGAASSMMSLIAGIIVLLIMILAAVFEILYYIQTAYGIRVIRTNVKTGMDIGRLPGFAIFVGFAGCAFTVLSMLPMAPDDYIGLVSKGSYAAWLLLSACWALIYRGTVKVK